jgi:small multidrug resistance family-3 protein
LKELLLLAVAAALECGGDALIRAGLTGSKAWLLAFGATVLFAYGMAVNLPKWDFSKLMGVYISIFFVVSQAIAIIAFHEKPKMPILVGGALIVAGGLVISLWKPAG